jgi:hypothetical protein
MTRKSKSTKKGTGLEDHLTAAAVLLAPISQGSALGTYSKIGKGVKKPNMKKMMSESIKVADKLPRHPEKTQEVAIELELLRQKLKPHIPESQ